jgi:hypothetical protein
MDDVLRQEGGVAYSDGIALMLRYEAADRRLFWEHNSCAEKFCGSRRWHTTTMRIDSSRQSGVGLFARRSRQAA